MNIYLFSYHLYNYNNVFFYQKQKLIIKLEYKPAHRFCFQMVPMIGQAFLCELPNYYCKYIWINSYLKKKEYKMLINRQLVYVFEANYLDQEKFRYTKKKLHHRWIRTYWHAITRYYQNGSPRVCITLPDYMIKQSTSKYLRQLLKWFSKRFTLLRVCTHIRSRYISIKSVRLISYKKGKFCRMWINVCVYVRKFERWSSLMSRVLLTHIPRILKIESSVIAHIHLSLPHTVYRTAQPYY